MNYSREQYIFCAWLKKQALTLVKFKFGKHYSDFPDDDVEA